MPDLDRSRLALYVALGLLICFLGARYLRSAGAPAVPVAESPAGRGAPGGGGAGAASGDGADASVRLDRAGGGRVTIHVAGAVRRPGLYRLPAGARVDDALRRAGGAGRRADLAAVNLAAKVEDGRQILVPERARAGAASAGPPAGGAAAGGGGAAGAAAAGASGAGAAPAPAVNLNTATLEQLDTLDGVGPGIAKRILDYREQHGGFRNVDELGQVPGIGAKRMATLRPLVTA